MQVMRRFGVTLIASALLISLGWQLGTHYQEQILSRRIRQLEVFYGGESGSGKVLSDPEREADLSLLWAVWRLLQQHYIEPTTLTSDKLIMGATEGLVRAVGDPYTVFMEPEENQEFHDGLAGTLQGIGAELQEREETIVIVSPLKGSPAAKAGLLPNDIILTVDDETTEGLHLGEVVSKIRGPKGTKVTLTVFREKEAKPLEFTITRDEIQVPSVEAEVRKTATGSVGILALNQFGEHSIEEVRRELVEFEKQNVDGIVLDLRWNGGGYLEGAVDLASFFLKEGRVVTVESRANGTQHHAVSGKPIFPELPLVILQNEGSASASEIVAGALQDVGRATVIGTKSFGKGTVQEVIELPGGGSLRVTIAKWFTPKGRDLGKEGVVPDIVAERSAEDIQAERDPQLDAALRVVFQK